MTLRSDTSLMSDAKMVKAGWFEHGTARIYYEESGSGDPVLILPGFSDRIETHMPLRSALAAAGYRVIAADLPGSGKSQPQPRAYTASYFDDDAHLFAALLQHLGAAPAHLMGFSDGGETALLIAATMPAIARTVVTWGSGGVLSDPTGQLRQVMFNLVDQPIPPLQGYRDYLVATYGETNARAMTQSQTSALGAIIEQRGGDVSFSKAGNIICPVLLIAGEHDMFVTLLLISRLAAQITNAETLEVKDAGHDVHNANPEWFAQIVVDWLKTK